MPRYTLHPQVGLRHERFGALAYHYGNRRLTFLNDAQLVAVVEVAGEHADVTAAFDAVGVDAARRPAFLAALERLRQAEVVTCE